MNTAIIEKSDTTMAEQSELKRTQAGLRAAFLGIGYLRIRSALSAKSLMTFLIVALALAAVTLFLVKANSYDRFNIWMFSLFVLKIVPLICLASAGGSLRNEIKDYTIEYLWTRSAKKSHLVIAEFFSSVVVTVFKVYAFTIVIHLVGLYLNVPEIVSMLPRILAVEFFAILAYSALAMLLGVITGKYMILGVIYGVIVEIGISQVPLNLNKISVSHHVRTMMGDLSAVGVPGDASSLMLGAMGCISIASIGLLAACIVFSRKQYRIGDEKEG